MDKLTKETIVDKVIINKIQSYVKKGLPFTTWDVAMDVRNGLNMTKDDLTNNYVREFVNEWFGFSPESNHWEKTSVYVKNGKIATVFHPIDVDPSEYVDFDSYIGDEVDSDGCSCDGDSECSLSCGCCDEDEHESCKSVDVMMTKDAGLFLANAVESFLNGETTLEALEQALHNYDLSKD
jgi:hypothetical protein